MRNSANGRILAILSLAVWSSQTHAADDSAAVRCSTISDDHARLACYDSIFRGTGESASAGPVATGGAPGISAAADVQAAGVALPAASPTTPTTDFGLTPARKESIQASEAKASGAAVVPKEPPVPDSITVKVATLAHRLTGELVVITDSGQVWTQIDTENKARLKEGDEVIIRKATLGSYFLVTPNHVLVRVRRVK